MLVKKHYHHPHHDHSFLAPWCQPCSRSFRMKKITIVIIKIIIIIIIIIISVIIIIVIVSLPTSGADCAWARRDREADGLGCWWSCWSAWASSTVKGKRKMSWTSSMTTCVSTSHVFYLSLLMSAESVPTKRPHAIGRIIRNIPSSRLVTFQHKFDFQIRRLSYFLKNIWKIMFVVSQTH